MVSPVLTDGSRAVAAVATSAQSGQLCGRKLYMKKAVPNVRDGLQK
jgi:hypothetical protein